MEDIELYRPSYDEIRSYTKDITNNILVDGFAPDAIVGLLRGGAIIARAFSDEMHNCPVTTMDCDATGGVGKLKEPRIVQDISMDIRNKDVLVCDDISERGYSLKLSYDHLDKKGPKSLKTATIYIRKGSLFIPDYFYPKDPGDYWIVFPGEEEETIRDLMKEGKEHVLLKVFSQEEINDAMQREWLYKKARNNKEEGIT